jgi:hypothetical protein
MLNLWEKCLFVIMAFQLQWDDRRVNCDALKKAQGGGCGKEKLNKGGSTRGIKPLSMRSACSRIADNRSTIELYWPFKFIEESGSAGMWQGETSLVCIWRECVTVSTLMISRRIVVAPITKVFFKGLTISLATLFAFGAWIVY